MTKALLYFAYVCVCAHVYGENLFFWGLNTTEDTPIKHYIAWLNFTCGIQST